MSIYAAFFDVFRRFWIIYGHFHPKLLVLAIFIDFQKSGDFDG